MDRNVNRHAYTDHREGMPAWLVLVGFAVVLVAALAVFLYPFIQKFLKALE